MGLRPPCAVKARCSLSAGVGGPSGGRLVDGGLPAAGVAAVVMRLFVCGGWRVALEGYKETAPLFSRTGLGMGEATARFQCKSLLG